MPDPVNLDEKALSAALIADADVTKAMMPFVAGPHGDIPAGLLRELSLVSAKVGARLATQTAPTAGEECLHRWVDATNELVSGTAYCDKCGRLAPLRDVLRAAVRAEERECLNGLLREERKLVRRSTLAEVREKVEAVERLNLPERDWVERAAVLAALDHAMKEADK